MQQRAEGPRGAAGAIGAAGHPASGADAPHLYRGGELIHTPRHDERRNARSHPLRGGADAAVVDHRRTARVDAREGRIRDDEHAVGQRSGQRVWCGADDERPTDRLPDGGDTGLVEGVEVADTAGAIEPDDTATTGLSSLRNAVSAAGSSQISPPSWKQKPVMRAHAGQSGGGGQKADALAMMVSVSESVPVEM